MQKHNHFNNSNNINQCYAFNTSTNIATPFIRSSCFEPAYQNTLKDFLTTTPSTFYNIKQSRAQATDPMCLVDTNYGRTSPSPINPMLFGSFDSRNCIWRRENSIIVGKAPQDYKSKNGATCPQQPYYVLDESDRKKVVCPILTSESVQPQCSTCLNTVFQCEQLKEVDSEAYKACKKFQRMIHYDVVTPNGQLIPVAYEMDEEGPQVFHAAVEKCKSICGSCQGKE
jgi:hypothetical protein